MSTLTYFFLKHGGHIKCEMTGGKKYSKDLEQGGLEIDNQRYKRKVTDIMKENLNPIVEEYRRTNSKPK